MRFLCLLLLAASAACSPVSFAPVHRVVVKHSGELGVPTRSKAAPCSNEELADYALRLAVGPAPEPACQPSPGQTLLPKILSAASTSNGPAMFRTNDRPPSVTTSRVYFAHLYVVQSDEGWCPHPCNQPTWEIASPKPDDSSPYLLLEAAIWRQTRTVTLYHFDAAWEQRARSSFTEFCKSQSWGCAEYEKFRESRALFSVGPWPPEADNNPKMLSSFLRKAFSRILGEVFQRSGSDTHIGLTYNGHGGYADGSMFNGALLKEDASAMLRIATNSSKLSLFNFAGNCEEGRWNMLQAFQPFADWILASDLKVGGLLRGGAANSSDETAVINAAAHLQDVAVLKHAIESREAPSALAKKVVDARQQLWEGAQRLGIIQQSLRQSLSGFETASFQSFKAALSGAFWALPAQMQPIVTNYVEESSCDVLVATRLLDAGLSGGATSANFKQLVEDLHKAKGRVKQHNAGPLELQFQALRPLYVSTRSLFNWDTESNGLGFNMLHWKCDFAAAFGDGPHS